jgi:hypothetical protein
MTTLNPRASFFSFANPLRGLDRLLNGYRHRKTVQLNRRPLELRWSDRAERELQRRGQTLVVELQLYFSCVVKKRVLFHDGVDFATTRVDDRLEISFRPIASAVCDPREFAAHHPPGRDLSPGPAARMVPAFAEIDFRAGRWQGRFGYR